MGWIIYDVRIDVAANLRVSALMRAAPSIPYLVVIEAKKESFLSGKIGAIVY